MINFCVIILVYAVLPPSQRNPGASLRPSNILASYASIFRHRPTLGLIASFFFRAASVWGFYTYRGAFFVQKYNLTSTQVGWIISLAGAGGLLGSLVVGTRFTRRVPLRPLVIGGAALIGLLPALALMFPVSTSVWQ